MESFVLKVTEVGNSKYPNNITKKLSYGTAGVRARATDLSFAVFRLGVLATLRSRSKSGKAIGVVITASHNPEPDNGVKIVDPMGEMMEAKWESYVNQLISYSDGELSNGLKKLVETEEAGIDLDVSGHVIVARDTRPSSPELSQALIDGVKAAGGTYKDYGLLTTPQLHYLVHATNTNNIATEEVYYKKLTSAFKKIIEKLPQTHDRYLPQLVLDGANGVGAGKMKIVNKMLEGLLKIDVCNDGNGTLNHECGSDFVKTNQTVPSGVTMRAGMRGASFDGDADRVVYYYADQNNKFGLLDGDKIATLIASYLKSLIGDHLPLELGLVQTAYANGSSTRYITEQLKIPVACTPTGVKHLHHRAVQFDIGVYFEANGHGTVVFSPKALDMINNACKQESLDENQKEAMEKLKLITELINQTVGDAISDVLLVEVILRSLDWSADNWNQCYTDLPNRLRKVVVKDRSVISTADAERRAVTPSGLQDGIDQLVAKYKYGRSFVRPSGTEDIVRVYAEADTQENCDLLAFEVSNLVFELAGGVGAKPEQ